MDLDLTSVKTSPSAWKETSRVDLYLDKAQRFHSLLKLKRSGGLAVSINQIKTKKNPNQEELK
jgi:hypothetical protein